MHKGRAVIIAMSDSGSSTRTIEELPKCIEWLESQPNPPYNVSDLIAVLKGIQVPHIAGRKS